MIISAAMADVPRPKVPNMVVPIATEAQTLMASSRFIKHRGDLFWGRSLGGNKRPDQRHTMALPPFNARGLTTAPQTSARGAGSPAGGHRSRARFPMENFAARLNL